MSAFWQSPVESVGKQVRRIDLVRIRWRTAGGRQTAELQGPQDMEGFLRKLLSMPRFCEVSRDSQDALYLDEAFAALFEQEAGI